MLKKNKSKDKVIMFHEDGSCSVHKVIEVLGNSVEIDKGLWDIADAKKVYDHETSGSIYIFNVDLPAKVEADNLKNLRRSVTLKRMFDYDKGKEFNLTAFMPWVALLAALLLK